VYIDINKDLYGPFVNQRPLRSKDISIWNILFFYYFCYVKKEIGIKERIQSRNIDIDEDIKKNSRSNCWTN